VDAFVKLFDLVQTLKGAAIDDAILSVQKFNEARLDYLSTQESVQLLRCAPLTSRHPSELTVHTLSDANEQLPSHPPTLLEADAAAKLAEKKAHYDQLGRDIDAKIQLLNEHRCVLPKKSSLFCETLKLDLG